MSDARRVGASDDDDEGAASSVLADLARELSEDIDEVVAGVTGYIADTIDDLSAETGLLELLTASVHGNVSTILDVMSNKIPMDHLQPTTAAVEYAFRLAQRNVSANALVRAYHLGAHEMQRMVLQRMETRDLAPQRTIDVISEFAMMEHQYIDWIIRYVLNAYESERQRWSDMPGSVLVSAIEELMNDPGSGATRFETKTGYSLKRTHLAVIAWDPDTESSARRLHSRILAAAGVIDSPAPPLQVTIDETTVWNWIPVDAAAVRTLDLTRLRESMGGAHLAMGEPLWGPEGFKRSHEQARIAFSCATTPGRRSRPVTSYAEPGLAATALIAKDTPEARIWVRETLGPLAADTPQAAESRETLATYLAENRSLIRTAELLHVHKNTVRYRISRILADLDAERRVGDTLDLALALRVHEHLGSGP
ncbi:PucR family transcriptional regulator [Dietzia sp. SLG310A2-38A2]|uniref:PucR family transcriptional regulator n=1 Tax=Dietzia sp. SLG310A2-38A2 TaxID=1630643 RepID=UPI0015FBB622|nr:helix-turn-helix domain-containing protein [Dietzia sp. SLG310A2-38A2]MBB1032759.1 PucR family transcriptional regulator [Dietzia sp. SLG310A2-38A2]